MQAAVALASNGYHSCRRRKGQGRGHVGFTDRASRVPSVSRHCTETDRETVCEAQGFEFLLLSGGGIADPRCGPPGDRLSSGEW